ncbi:peptide chain release factor H [Chromobacterium phragmitis]|uniref:Peptide chain release factor H n=1 Tax=Chromobacterium phragmitis TaxID=2202141 RepID=A0A344ULB4_9NEIS|nr:peptide chain release factor H [Chromobacterium phragmitis]AXE30691.1 peptide chain release factor H [Chromobacterium phragmitis]AXE36062.1 peptide chain release factor H [Chromobacterium phragmitis]
MILLQITAAQGPDECALAAAKTLSRLQAEAHAAGVKAALLESEPGPRAGTVRSALLALDGEAEDALAAAWIGTIQWTCSSPYRPRHPRKNWFVGVARCETPAPAGGGEVRIETCRASGPGGQHVNKTESAVRAVHLASGVSVRVQSERSQHANKRLALLLLAHKLGELAEQADADLRGRRRQLHWEVERGNPLRVFHGERFRPAS